MRYSMVNGLSLSINPFSACTVMNDQDQKEKPRDHFLGYRGEFPLSWSLCESMPREMEFDQANESNENLLKVASSFTEHLPESDEFADLIPEFVRLDQKLNMVLEFLGILLTREFGLPGKREVELGSGEMFVPGKESETLPVPGDILKIDVYIQSEVPKPLKIYGQVVDNDNSRRDLPTHRMDAKDKGEAQEGFSVDFIGTNQSVEVLLEKFIFRHHRRLVALRRNQ